jgi:hypothetical protein
MRPVQVVEVVKEVPGPAAAVAGGGGVLPGMASGGVWVGWDRENRYLQVREMALMTGMLMLGTGSAGNGGDAEALRGGEGLEALPAWQQRRMEGGSRAEF